MTERILDLNREKLVERRTERLDQFLALVAIFERSEEPLKSLIKDDMLKETEEEREYASMVRTIIAALGIA